jgi:hypothetical protein
MLLEVEERNIESVKRWAQKDEHIPGNIILGLVDFFEHKLREAEVKIENLTAAKQPVTLPKEVVDCIEHSRSNGLSKYGIIDNFARWRTGSLAADKWAKENDVSIIIQALVNGYRVESWETTCRNGLKLIYRKHFRDPKEIDNEEKWAAYSRDVSAFLKDVFAKEGGERAGVDMSSPKN